MQHNTCWFIQFSTVQYLVEFGPDEHTLSRLGTTHQNLGVIEIDTLFKNFYIKFIQYIDRGWWEAQQDQEDAMEESTDFLKNTVQ